MCFYSYLSSLFFVICFSDFVLAQSSDVTVPTALAGISDMPVLPPPDLKEFKELDSHSQIELFERLSNLQSKNRDAQKMVKGKAWRRLVRVGDEKSSISRLEFAFSTSGGNRSFEKYFFRTNKEVNAPPKLEHFQCMQGYLETPTFRFVGDGYSGLGLDTGEIELPRPDQPSPTGLNFENSCDRLGLALAPAVFWKELKNAVDTGHYMYSVRQHNDHVALEVWRPDRTKSQGRFWIFDVAQSGCCVFHQNSIIPSATQIWETNFSKVNDCYLPSSIKQQTCKQRLNQPPDLLEHSVIEFYDVSTGEFDTKVFGMANFPWLTPNITVKDKRTGRAQDIEIRELIKDDKHNHAK